jgi:hypothetical protein
MLSYLKKIEANLTTSNLLYISLSTLFLAKPILPGNFQVSITTNRRKNMGRVNSLN